MILSKKGKPFHKIRVTGYIYMTNKRFPPQEYSNDIGGALTAMGINLWRGTVWGVFVGGKKEVIKKVFN
jgi:hypothetical protein